MPIQLKPVLRPLAVAMLMVGAGWVQAETRAPADQAASAAASAVDAGPAAASAAAATGKRPKPDRIDAALARGPKDPMEMLRDRLAQKLGTRPELEPKDPSVLRVETKVADGLRPSAAGASAVSGAPGARRLTSVSYGMLDPRSAARGRAPSASVPAEWDYAGAGGPERWGQLKSEFSRCASGARQSPIDIRDGIKVDLAPIQFDYTSSAFRVIDTGHTVQVNIAAGNAIEVMGRRYELLQFVFHRPSEERVDGHQAAMDVHLVHKDAEGHLAIVAVQIEEGAAQPVVQSVWNDLPLERGVEVVPRSPMNLAGLLPAERGYYTYMGSMTAPPCSEGVLWMVMKTPLTASAQQLAIFSRLYPMNARPVQSASGRLVKESN